MSLNLSSCGDLDPLRISLLGRFEVSVGNKVIRDEEWRLRKAANLAKLLALAPDHRLHREQVMNFLWPNLPPGAAANNLHQALHVARRTIEPGAASPRYLRLHSEHLMLYPNGSLWVDVKAFEKGAAAARRARDPAAYRQALELYAGDLLPGDRYEDWADSHRKELRGSYLALLVEMAGLYEERGKFDPAIEALREVVSSEPIHEEAHAGLMRLYARTGQRFKALRQYELLHETLRRELGAEPGVASRRVHAGILDGQIPTAEPPYASLTVRPSDTSRHNIPGSLTSFVGREREKEEVKRLLGSTCLLTLTGTGGCGKTRLAREVSEELAAGYPDGVWLVELAPLSDKVLVPQVVAETLEVSEEPGRSLETTLAEALRKKNMLLVLDNCEHLVEATARFAERLLSSCPKLRILTTSREVLGAQGEVAWLVPSLSGPGTVRRHTIEEIEGYESVRLFVERARYRNPAFALTPQNAGAVVEICTRLAGLPLAIELAAARVGLSVEQIVGRLHDSLKLLTSGGRTLTPRQRTLRGTLDWSYDLLDGGERTLFGRLSVFAGGYTLEAAEAAGSGSGIEEDDVLDLLSRLVDKSLVVANMTGNGGVRYRLLEPVRQYGQERLAESGEADDIRRRHAAWFLALAEKAEPELKGGRQGPWLERLEQEHDNLRAALSWTLERREVETALRLSGSLGKFWEMRGHLTEGRRWLEAALATGSAQSPARLKALAGAGWIATEQGDYGRATTASEECLALARKLGDKASVATALFNLGSMALFQNEHERASELLEEAVALQRESGDAANLARALQPLGLVAVARHDQARATEIFDENLALSRQMDDDMGIVLSLGLGALAALGGGDHAQARDLVDEGMERATEKGYKHAIAFYLHVLAAVAGTRGQPARSARLWGAAEALREAIGTTLSPVEVYYYGPYITEARAGLDAAAWEAAWGEGRAMSLEETIEYALRQEEPASGNSDILTPRERKIANLIAQGMTSRQIAADLCISPRTVDTHTGKIFKKLGIHSRNQLAVRLNEQRHSSPPPA